MKAQKIYLEHANITVANLDRAIHFFKTAFPHFEIRGGGEESRKWVHLGDDNTYIAINQATEESEADEKNYDKIGINHIGFVVEDVDQISIRLSAEGYQRDYPKQVEKYRIREYFLDAEGNEYEFVQYLSDKLEERNYYDV